MELVELALETASVPPGGGGGAAPQASAALIETEEVDELESTVETRSVRKAVSAFDSCARSAPSSETVDVDDELETVDAVELVDALDEELEDCSAARRLARSVSIDDSRLLALDELSLEVDEVESLALVAPGGGPGGGPPGGGPPTPPALWLLEDPLWLLSDSRPPSCDRKLSTAADRPTAAEAS